jgi:V/A-type H+-transporting ATPase subunit I
MSIRPAPARWFEILVTRDDLLQAIDVLADSGKVELEIHSDVTRRAIMPDLRDRFADYHQMLRRFQKYWPKQDLKPSDLPGKPSERLNNAMNRLHTWQQAAEPIVDQLEKYETEATELHLMQNMFSNMQSELLDFGDIINAGPAIATRLYVLPASAHLAHVPPSLLSIRATDEQRIYLLVLGTIQDINELQHELVSIKGRALFLPAWLKGNQAQAVQMIDLRLNEIGHDVNKLQQQLTELAGQHKLTEVLGDIHQIEWFLTHISELPVTENFAWITGWTSSSDDNYLNRRLEQANIRAVVHYPAPPVDIHPPMVLTNPKIIKPFELFTRMLGVPAETETDPSFLLAIIVPLMFGYMFGDVGHGAVLLLAGIVLQHRWPLLRLFISCGLASILFGFVFGSVFAHEHIIEAWWVSPVQQPLTVLFVPLLGGILILLLGLILNGVQAYWRGEVKRWFFIEAAVLVIYIGLLASLAEPWALWISLAGAAWYLAGNAILAESHLVKTLFIAVGQLVESMFQLVINTISFVRVGAFALAHSGLSLAVIVLSESTGITLFKIFILVLGNIVILVLEGLVVSIQTTRLVLFEFFIRFLHGSGRIFQPMHARPDQNPTDKES